MEIVITHTIHPDVIALLKSFVNPSLGGQTTNGKEIATPVETIKPGKTKASVTAPAKETLKETVAETTGTTTAPAATTEVQELTFTDIRQLYMQKKDAGKREEVKKIIDSYGVEKLSALPKEKYQEVYEKMNAL